MTMAAAEPSRSAGAPICVPEPSTKDTPGYPSTVHSWSEALVRTSVRYTLPAPPPPSWSWIVPVSCAALQRPTAAGGDTLGDGAALTDGDGEGEVEGDGAALTDGDGEVEGDGAALTEGEADGDGEVEGDGAVLVDGEADALGSADGVGTSLVASADGDADGDAADEADGAADPPSSGSDAVQPLTATSAPAVAMAVIQRLLPSKVVMPSPYVRCTRRPVGRTGFRRSVP